eukprot:1134489-Pelagomonas_calceolata.AAC.8
MHNHCLPPRMCVHAVIFEDKDGLLNVTGGKWTTYRAMAEQAIDLAMASGKLPKSAKPCQVWARACAGQQQAVDS